MSSGYLRFPHLHADLITFVAGDDVWLAPVEGGRAWRLTHDSVPASNPRFSPDGQHIAYVSTRDGHHEVMVIATDGGSPRRLTWWATANTRVLGWTADGRVLAASNGGEANLRHAVVKAVALDGTVERLPYGMASGLALHPKGAIAVSTPWSRPPAHWKRYRGGTAPKLWLDKTGRGRWNHLLAEDEAGLVDPMWLDDALVFTSDRGGRFPDRADEQANLWIWDTPGRGEPRQLTHQSAEQGYVRDATTDGARIVWHSRGRIFILDSLDAEPRAIDISASGLEPTVRSVQPTENLDRLRPDHGGDASVVEWRGSAHLLSHREGPARAIVAVDGVRVREAQPLGTTGKIVLVSDAAGEDRIEVHSRHGDAEPQVLATKVGRVLCLQADPQGRRVAWISHDGTIAVADVTTGRRRGLGESTEGEATGLAFSPDGRHLAWSQPVAAFGAGQLMAVDLDARRGSPVALTSGRFADREPAFTADGKYLTFLSARTFDPVYDAHTFDLAFGPSVRPWLAPLSATEPAPFGPSADGWRLSRPSDAEAKDTGEGTGSAQVEEAAPSAHLDADGFEERIIPFPVPSGDFRALQSIKNGVLWIRESAEHGQLGSTRAGVSDDDPGDVVEAYSFLTRRVETLVDKADDVRVSGDGERMVVREGETVTVRPTDRKVEGEDKDLVTVDLGRLRRQLDPRAEWRQMYEENARIMRDHFWRADMDGVDWDAVVERYRPLIDRVATHDDLVDVLWECVGELNTSHAYVQPATPPGDAERKLGLLGVDLARTGDTWSIVRVLPGESSDPEARSPLRAAGVDAQPGDQIVAVDGTPVDAAVGPAAGLVGAAEKPVELTLRRKGTDRRVVVVPLADEETLRYQDWVRSRSAYVAEKSDGRLGYLHIPDMMSKGWAQLFRDLTVATRAEGIVVDVRYNRGGHTSALVIEQLARRIIGYQAGRHVATAESYPSPAPRGPLAFVANEFSGSDGDIVNAAAQSLGLGPVIGVRTWGGVVGIDGRFSLVDGTGITQPRYVCWFDNYGYGVENHGVDPDIEVPVPPGDFDSDADAQLDRAIKELLSRLRKSPAVVQPELPEPKVR
ncbi:S41 family peptidase [Propionibacteriaceae bacterium Y1700]|uniref:S41 family peptidase n=1 Tax=Microlunatus sp. Y1700 TaxID=3418487 RepID=UPI003DA79EB9